MRLQILILFLATSTTTWSQGTDQWQQLKDKYPDEPAVFIDHSETVTIQVKDDSLNIFSDVQEEMLYLKEQGEVFANRRVHGSHFNTISDLKAKTLVWDKNKYREFQVSNFLKKFDTDDGIFYDDSYYYSFSYPSVAPHNRTQLQYRTKYKDSRFLPGFIFASYLPQVKSVYTIKTTRDVELVYEVLNDDKKQVQFKKYEKGKEVIYEWSAQNVLSYKTDSNSPAIRYYTPHVICYVKSYNTSKGKQTVLSGLDDLYKWYYSFIKDVNKEPSQDLVAIVNKLKKPGDTEEETVKKIFYWVQNNIRYIAFEEGMRGLIPNSGSYVCEKRYGDCKDMANLIVCMLKIAGIEAHHTWIGTRDLPYQYSKVPTPLVDNHMIATYISKDGKYYFLDGTSNHTAFGFPSSMIQGKEALISLGPDKYEVKRVPEIPKEQNEMTDSITLKIADSQLIGSGSASVTGYPKVFASYRLDRAQEDDTKQYVTKLVGKGSNKFYLDNYKIADLNDQDRKTRIDYSFRIGDYFQQISGEIYINLNLNKDYYNEYINTAKRETPWENDYRYVKNEICVLKIPDGYTVDYIPENVSVTGKNIGVDVHYDVSADKVVMKKSFYIDFLMLPPDQFQNWNESVKRMSDVYKESIILKKK